MKYGDIVHVGGGHLVTLCHTVAYIPALAAVLWHTQEEGTVLLWHDIRGHLCSRVVVDEVAFMSENKYQILKRQRKGKVDFLKLLLGLNA